MYLQDAELEGDKYQNLEILIPLVIYPLMCGNLSINNANGRCTICGKHLAFSEMTLDHIIPLNQKGADEVENLQSCCYQCNQMKGSILPVDLFQKVTEIYMYQMEKNATHRLKWKIAHKLLLSCNK